jgi:hypothetical protein
VGGQEYSRAKRAKKFLGVDPPLLQGGPPSTGSKGVKVQLEATNKTNDVTESIAINVDLCTKSKMPHTSQPLTQRRTQTCYQCHSL